MAMQTLVNLFIKIFIMIGVGYFLRKREVISGQLKQGMNHLIMNVILPFSVIASGNSDFSSEMSQNLMEAAVFSVIYYLGAMAIGMLAARVLHLEERRGRIFMMLTTFANVGFLGIPLSTELFGSEGALIAVVNNLVFDVIFFTFGVYYVSRKGSFELKKIFGNVVAMSAIFAVALYCSPFRLPAVIEDTFRTIGNSMVPLSMMTIGCGLAEVKITEVLKNRLAYLVSAMRLLIYPLAALLIAKAVGMDHVTAAACVMLTAMPPGSTNAIIAEQYDCAPEFATQAVVQSMVLMLATLPLIMMLVS